MKIFEYFKNLFFPKQCLSCSKYGKYLCDFCKNKSIHFETVKRCHVCKAEIWNVEKQGTVHSKCRGKTELKDVEAVVKYSKLVERIIAEIKYKFYFDVVEVIGELISEKIDINYLKNAYLIPIPLHKYKFNKRGFNQTQLIADNVRKRMINHRVNCEVIELLERTRNTKTQVGMSKEERHLNLDGAFQVNISLSNPPSPNSRLILVDDVYTTGTTLEKCALVLKQNGYQNISALVFARA